MLQSLRLRIRWWSRPKNHRATCPYCQKSAKLRLTGKGRRVRLTSSNYCQECLQVFHVQCEKCSQNLYDLSARCWNCGFAVYPPIAIREQEFLHTTAALYRQAIDKLGEDLTTHCMNADPFVVRLQNLNALPNPWAKERTIDFVRWGPEIYAFLQTSVRNPTKRDLEAFGRRLTEAITQVFEAFLQSYSNRVEICRTAFEPEEDIVNNRARHANTIIEHAFATIAEIERTVEIIALTSNIDAARARSKQLIESAHDEFHPGLLKQGANRIFRGLKGTAEVARGLIFLTVGAAAAVTAVGAIAALKLGAIDLPFEFPEIDLSSDSLSPTANDLIATFINDPLNMFIDSAEEAIAHVAVEEISGRLAALAAVAPLAVTTEPEKIPNRLLDLMADYDRCLRDLQTQINTSIRKLADALSWDLTLLRTNELSLLREAALAGVSTSTLGLVEHPFIPDTLAHLPMGTTEG